MGDSYASGIGAGALPQEPDPDRCFRCSNAYPKLIQSGQTSLQPNPERFNFVACSGAKFSEILQKQLSDQDRPGRPAWGDAPEFVTITMGGNDIGILALVLTCIYSIRILVIGCDAVIQRGFDIVESDDFRRDMFEVIYIVQSQGRRLHGPNFHIFVTGYAQLFNSRTEQCDGVTFKPDSLRLPAQYLTQARRRRMNELALSLNLAIKAVVENFPGGGVTFVDYDALFNGHRFCDRFEPNANDDETWFFQYGTTSDPTNHATGGTEMSTTNGTGNQVARSFPPKARSRAAKSSKTYDTGMPRRISRNKPRDDTVAANSIEDSNAGLSDYFRVFHPKTRGHQAIRGAIIQAIEQVLLSRGADTTTGPRGVS